MSDALFIEPSAMVAIERAVQGEYERQAEEFLGCIQEIEGRRVPIDELAAHGVRFVFPDGSTAFQWHGVTLLTFPPPFETSPPRRRCYGLSIYDAANLGAAEP